MAFDEFPSKPYVSASEPTPVSTPQTKQTDHQEKARENYDYNQHLAQMQEHQRRQEAQSAQSAWWKP